MSAMPLDPRVYDPLTGLPRKQSPFPTPRLDPLTPVLPEDIRPVQAAAPEDIQAPGVQMADRVAIDDMTPELAARKRGILGTLGDKLADPTIKASLLRAGATMLSGGNIGEGILAGAGYHDTRRREAASQAASERDYGLKERGVLADERASDARVGQGWRDLELEGQRDTNTAAYQRGSLYNQKYGIDRDSDDRQTGFRTQRYLGELGASTDRYQADKSYAASTYGADKGVEAAAYRADRSDDKVPSPDRVKGILNLVLPSATAGFNDPDHVAEALQSNPQLYGEMSNAVTLGYEKGGPSGALAAARGILDRYSYSPYQPAEDNWGPWNTEERKSSFKPKGDGGQPAQGGGGAGGLAPGTTVDGFTFVGGDPNDAKNWRKGA